VNTQLTQVITQESWEKTTQSQYRDIDVLL